MNADFIEKIGASVSDISPDGSGFIVLVATGQNLRYTSNLSRAEAILVLKEWLIKCVAEEDWMQHIK